MKEQRISEDQMSGKLDARAIDSAASYPLLNDDYRTLVLQRIQRITNTPAQLV
jgi:hypothetical protein